MLVFSAITPHPPILIPNIGRDVLAKIKKTQQAMQQVAEEFYHSQPDTVIVISPHSDLLEHAFTINTAPNFMADFKGFGDLETELEFQGDAALAYQIKEFLETSMPLQMIAREEVDHGTSVPLYYLIPPLLNSVQPNVKKTRVIPFGYSGQDLATHFKLGEMLADFIHSSKKRIAVVASGDLSHALTKQAPAGYAAQGKKFDKQLVDLINKKDAPGILKFDDKFVQAAAECGLKSIVILLGILSEQNYTPEVLSYEGPFGVGYLVCNFELNR